jgi:predicted Zn finger-like uncharacterized protein
MNLTCPSCATTFVVETQQLGPVGRQVRCGNCGNSWYQAPTDEADETESAAAPGAAAAAGGAESPQAERRERPEKERLEKPGRRRPPKVPRPRDGGGRASLLLGWLLFLAVIGGLASGLYYGRDQVVRLVPAAAALYELAGLGEMPAGVPLELRDVRTVRRVVAGKSVVVVEGLVANITDQPQSVPLLRASLTDAKGTELEHWTFSASATTLPPGGTTGFETTAESPPSEGSILIDFMAAK